MPRRDNTAVQGRSPRPSKNVPTLSEIIANAGAWSNRAEARAAGAQLVSGPHVVNGLGGRHCLPSTSQRAGRGTTRRWSPLPMEVEGGHVHISQRRTRRRRHTCVTGGVGLGRRRGSIPSRVRRGRGGEVAPTENGRTSDGPSHSPLLMNAAVLAPQNARRAAGSSAQPRILSGSTTERTQQGYQAFPSSDGVHSMPSDTALRSLYSSSCSQGARRGANSFVRRGLLGAGTSTRTSRRASNPPSIPPGATRGARETRHRYQDARCAISTSFRRGGAGSPGLRGVSRGTTRPSQAVAIRVRQCLPAFGH